jgi:hypothetical protein
LIRDNISEYIYENLAVCSTYSNYFSSKEHRYTGTEMPLLWHF